MLKYPWWWKLSNRRYELTDEQWERVRELIQHSKMRRPPKDDRVMLNAMLWMARSGAGWEDLPERYGSWKTVYSCFCKWRNDGTFLRIFQVLSEMRIWRIYRWILPAWKRTSIVLALKRGYKQRIQPVYRDQSWRKDNKNSCNCWWPGQSDPLTALFRKYQWLHWGH